MRVRNQIAYRHNCRTLSQVRADWLAVLHNETMTIGSLSRSQSPTDRSGRNSDSEIRSCKKHQSRLFQFKSIQSVSKINKKITILCVFAGKVIKLMRWWWEWIRRPTQSHSRLGRGALTHSRSQLASRHSLFSASPIRLLHFWTSHFDCAWLFVH